MGVLTDAMKEMIDRQRLGYVATVAPDGTPNVSPKGTVAAWDDDHLVFADIRSPQTVRNLRHNPGIEINVVDPILRKGYRFKGQGTVYDKGPEFNRFVAFYQQRGLANPIRAVISVQVQRALPLTSPAYDLGATEDEVTARWRRYWQEREAEAAAVPNAE